MQDACQVVQRTRELPLPVPPPADKAWQTVPHHYLVLKEETKGAVLKN